MTRRKTILPDNGGIAGEVFMGCGSKMEVHDWYGYVAVHADMLRTHKKKTKEEVMGLLLKGKVPNVQHMFLTSKKYGQVFYNRKHKGTYKYVHCEYDSRYNCFYVRYYGCPMGEGGRILWNKKVFEYKFVIENNTAG